MGGNLPVMKPKDAMAILVRLGFVMARQKRSHQQFRHPDGRATTIPVHGSRDLSPLLLRQICKDIGITTDELLKHR